LAQKMKILFGAQPAVAIKKGGLYVQLMSTRAHLEDLGFQVTMIKDEDVSEQIGRLDMLILGADRIEPDLAVNKIGSFMLARIFEEQMKPIYILADSRKIIESGKPVKGELFEKFPRKWLRGIITEKSIIE